MLRRPELPELEVSRVPGDGLSQHLCGLGLSLSLHDLLLLLLLGPVHDERRPLRLLLRHLLGLHGRRVLAAEAQLSDGHVVQDDVEVAGAVSQDLA